MLRVGDGVRCRDGIEGTGGGVDDPSSIPSSFWMTSWNVERGRSSETGTPSELTSTFS